MKRIVKLLCITFLVSLMLASIVSADDLSEQNTTQEKTITGIGTSGIKSPESNLGETDLWTGSYVWFGKYNGTPLKYRVLAPRTSIYGGETIFLDCNNILYWAPFDQDGNTNQGARYANQWEFSDIRTDLNGTGFLLKENGFTEIERNAISLSYLEDTDTPLTGEKIFLLDQDEAQNTLFGYNSNWDNKIKRTVSGGSTEWWLRSPAGPEYNSTVGAYALKVESIGRIRWAHLTIYGDKGNYVPGGISPAFNIDLSNVFFSSLVSGTSGQNNAEYKLTLKDSAMNIGIDPERVVFVSDGIVSIPYIISGDASKATQVSVLILNKEYTDGNTNSADILYYGRLNTTGSLSTKGVGTFSLPSGLAITGWGSSYFVYLLAEDVNGTYETDYASAPLLLDNIIIYGQPNDVTTTAGETATFSIVGAQGSEPLKYQWQSRTNASCDWANSGQSGARTATVSVATSAGLHGWQFRCVVTDAEGRKAFSDPATLTIIPKITVQPSDVYVASGSTAEFSVTATGKGNLRYQWQARKNADAAWANSGQSGSKTATLSVTTSNGLNGWQFRCIVTDSNGQSTNSDTVILSILGITAQPKDTSAEAGKTAQFTITAIGKGILTYQWQARKNAEATWSNSGQSGATTAALSVAATAGLNGWQFRCVVTGSNGQKVYSNIVTLSIVGFSSQPKSTSVTVGDVAEFTVTAIGKAPLTYQWQSRKNADATWANSGLSTAKTSTLTLTPTAGYHGYQFRCVVTDGNGVKAYSNAATLTVAPKISAQPQNVSVTVGSTATFTVAASGKTPFTYQWQSRKNADATWANSGLASAKSATLTLTPTAGYDGYQFRCVLTDANGQKVYSEAATLSILLNITTQPKDVGVTVGSTAKFTVAATGKATLTYQWQSRKNADTAWANSGVTGAKTATMSLTPTAGYHGYQFRCVITDGNGQKVYSDPATLSIIPTISTQPQNASAKSGATATFTVAATGKAPFTYQWQSRKDSSSSWANSGLSTAKQATLSVTVSPGLAGYQFRCVVTDANGQKAYSNGAVLSVLLSITSQPANASTTVGSTAKFTVAAKGKATLTYQWQSRKDSSSSWSNSGLSTAKEATLVVTASAGLDGYQFRCAVTDGYGKTVYTNAATISVNLSITSQPQSVSAAVGATAKFTVAAAGKATLTYQWQSRKNSSGSWANSGLSTAKSATLTVNVTAGLDGYQFRCIVTDGNGKKVYSDAATLTIPLVITKQPQNVKAEVNADVVFSVTATGVGSLKYQWQLGRSAQDAWVDIDKAWAKKATISIVADADFNGIDFRCVVTDGNGKKVYSNPARLTLKTIAGIVVPFGQYTLHDHLISYDAYYTVDILAYTADSNWVEMEAVVTVLQNNSTNNLRPRMRFIDKNGEIVYERGINPDVKNAGEVQYLTVKFRRSMISDAVKAVIVGMSAEYDT